MAKMVKCEKCGGMFDSRGINKHMEKCICTDEAEHKEIDKKESIKKCISCGCEKILRIDEFIEKVKCMGTVKINTDKLKKVYKDGYTHVCGDCGEVLK